MNTIQQTVNIPSNRRLRLDISLPDDIPEGKAEVLLVFAPAQSPSSAQSLSRFAGCLAHSETFAGDSVDIQKNLRNEW